MPLHARHPQQGGPLPVCPTILRPYAGSPQRAGWRVQNLLLPFPTWSREEIGGQNKVLEAKPDKLRNYFFPKIRMSVRDTKKDRISANAYCLTVRPLSGPGKISSGPVASGLERPCHFFIFLARSCSWDCQKLRWHSRQRYRYAFVSQRRQG